jgi:hypothetical protein
MTTLLDAPALPVNLGDQLRAWAQSTKNIQGLLGDLVPTSAIGVAETMADEMDAAFKQLFES